MAYSGGVYTKPIESGLSGLANLYLQGKMQVINMRAKVRKERSEELGALAKAASEIEATSVSEIDKLYQQGANLLREGAVKAHNDNVLGLTTRSTATSQVNNYTAQASQIANSSKIVSNNVEAMRKEFGAKLDSISEARYLRSWFTQKGKNQSILKIDDGQGGYLNVPGHEAISAEFDENNNINYRKSYNYVDPNTGEVEVGTNMTPVTDLANPSPSLIERFDANDNVKEFIATIGGSREVSMVRGEPAGDIQYKGAFRLGESDVFTRIIAPEALKDVGSRIEMELNSLASDDDTVISFLSQEFGARAPGDKGFTKMKSEQEINELFGATIVLGEDGKPTGQTIPKIYDELGQQVQFTNTYQVEDPPGSGQMKEFIMDPTTFQLNEFGIEQISDDQRNLFKAIMRDKYLKAMNVKVDDYKERDRPKRETDSEYLDVTLATHSKKTNGVTSTNKAAGYDYLNGIAIQQALAVAGGDTNVANLQNARTQFDSTGVVSVSDYIMDNQLDSFVKLVAKAENAGMVKGVNLSSNVKKISEKDFNLTTTTGQKLENFSQAFLVDTPGELPKLAFIGDAIMASSIDDYKLKFGGGDVAEQALKMNIRNEVVSPGIVVADNRKAAQFYRIMYQNNPQFQKIVEGAGFKGISADHSAHGKNAVMDALITYFNTKQ
jgi:hypothetical protein